MSAVIFPPFIVISLNSQETVRLHGTEPIDTHIVTYRYANSAIVNNLKITTANSRRARPSDC